MILMFCTRAEIGIHILMKNGFFCRCFDSNRQLSNCNSELEENSVIREYFSGASDHLLSPKCESYGSFAIKPSFSDSKPLDGLETKYVRVGSFARQIGRIVLTYKEM